MIQPGGIGLHIEHPIDRKVGPIGPQKIDIVELGQPIGIVDHDGPVFTPELKELLHLLHDALGILLDGLGTFDLAHLVLTGRIGHQGRAAADQQDQLVAGFLEVFEGHQRLEMTGGQ